ncbi:MAG: type II toxin-antitoxin system HicB family antitoxin [Clostridiales bacterium]|nr:type II toxin-antitoxin system HicB family antitoxin [Clostridiales bacterium]
MKYSFTAIFTPEVNETISVYFPDLPGCCTSGDDIPDALCMAQDALCLCLYDLEQDDKPIPAAGQPHEIKTSGNEFTSVVAVDTDAYRRFFKNKSIKKTLTIPEWLNDQAEKANINFSQTLQKALKVELNISE